MKKGCNVVARVCILSTLCMGCYSSVLIDPKGDEKEKIYSGNIGSVSTNDGTKYEFEKPPAVANDTIVGEIKIPMGSGLMRKQISIPLSDVAEVRLKEFQAVTSIVIWPTLLLAGIVLFR